MRSQILDIAIPLYGRSSTDLLAVLECIKAHTDIPFRMIVVNNGFGAELNDMIRAWSRDLDQFIFLQNENRAGFASCINQCVKHTNAENFVAVHPQVEIDDDEWVPKLTMPFRDRQAFMAGIDPYVPWNSNRPFALDKSDAPVHRGLVAFRRPEPEEQLLVTDSEEEPMRKTQARVIDRGQRVYLCPSIRLIVRRFDSPERSVASKIKPKTETLIFR